MVKLDLITNKLNGLRKKNAGQEPENLSVWGKIKKIISLIVTWIYRLRGVILAAPVVYAALKIADYNRDHLPETVGLNLQSTGEFAMSISRELAVFGPLVLTAACLTLMLCSRKVMYPWAVSIFTLVIPILLLISNIYPA